MWIRRPSARAPKAEQARELIFRSGIVALTQAGSSIAC